MGLRQLRAYVGVSERTIRAWIHLPLDGLPAIRVGGKILVRRSELDAWLQKRRVRPLEAVDLDDMVKDILQGLSHGR